MKTLALLLVASAAHASIFYNGYRRPRWNGVTDVRVCIEDGSTVDERSASAPGLIHDANPSLDDVILHIENALDAGWSRTGAVRFFDFRPCSWVDPYRTTQTIHLYIGTDDYNMDTTVGNDVRIRPWGFNGDVTQCIQYNWGTTHMEYHFDCVEALAVHEFGHVIGFLHEMQGFAGDEPPGCHDAQNQPISIWQSANWYPNNALYTVINWDYYDRQSLMAYDVNNTDCADGWHFGSATLDPLDEIGLRWQYPASVTDVPIAYQDPNFTGSAQALYPGFYPMAALKRVANDSMSSLRVPPNYWVCLFTDDNYGGAYRCYNQDTPALSDFDDQVSSAWVLWYGAPSDMPSAPVYVYEHWDGGGRYQQLWANRGETRYYDMDELKIGNDTISAIKLTSNGAGTHVVLWEHAGCWGRWKQFDTDPNNWNETVRWVGDDFNDLASCVQVTIDP